MVPFRPKQVRSSQIHAISSSPSFTQKDIENFPAYVPVQLNGYSGYVIPCTMSGTFTRVQAPPKSRRTKGRLLLMYLNVALNIEFSDPLLTRLHRPVPVSAQSPYSREHSFNNRVRTSGMQATRFRPAKIY